MPIYTTSYGRTILIAYASSSVIRRTMQIRYLSMQAGLIYAYLNLYFRFTIVIIRLCCRIYRGDNARLFENTHVRVHQVRKQSPPFIHWLGKQLPYRTKIVRPRY